MQIGPGATIGGKYVLERPLARGGMGSVWVARHARLGSTVAVKFLDAHLAASPLIVARFEREARAAATLDTPHVVQVHDYGVEDGAPYLVMELLRGEDLSARLKTRGRLPLAEAGRVLAQMSRALRRAHDAGIVHRDLKPANVFLARLEEDEEIVKILDFGIAKETWARADETTKTGEVFGSPHYMSPEQARAEKTVDQRADIWAVGVIAYRMLTGCLPFPGQAVGEVLSHVLVDPFPPLSQAAPDLPPALNGFFTRALAKKKEERFSTIAELMDSFRTILGEATGRQSLAEIHAALRTLDPAAPLPPVPASGPVLAPPSPAGGPVIPPPPPSGSGQVSAGPPTGPVGAPRPAAPAARGPAKPVVARPGGTAVLPKNTPGAGAPPQRPGGTAVLPQRSGGAAAPPSPAAVTGATSRPAVPAAPRVDVGPAGPSKKPSPPVAPPSPVAGAAAPSKPAVPAPADSAAVRKPLSAAEPPGARVDVPAPPAPAAVAPEPPPSASRRTDSTAPTALFQRRAQLRTAPLPPPPSVPESPSAANAPRPPAPSVPEPPAAGNAPRPPAPSVPEAPSAVEKTGPSIISATSSVAPELPRRSSPKWLVGAIAVCGVLVAGIVLWAIARPAGEPESAAAPPATTSAVAPPPTTSAPVVAEAPVPSADRAATAELMPDVSATISSSSASPSASGAAPGTAVAAVAAPPKSVEKNGVVAPRPASTGTTKKKKRNTGYFSP